MAQTRRERASSALSGLLGSGIGERTAAMLQGLSWNFPAAGATRVLSGLTTVLAARWMGPASFGQANLALAATLWIQVPLFFGLTTAVMHFVPKRDAEGRSGLAADGLALLSFCCAATLGLGWLFRDFWAGLQGLSPEVFLGGLLWCAGFWLYTVSTALLSAQERFKARAGVELAFGLLFPAAALLLWKAWRLGAAPYVAALSAAYLLSGAAGLWKAWPGLPRPGLAGRAPELLGYGLLAAAGQVTFALLYSLARLVANKALPLSEVGVLSAYQGGSVQFSTYFLAFSIQVFFPLASRAPDRPALFRKLSRLALPLTLGAWAACAACLSLYLLLLGRKYPFLPLEAALFSLGAGLTMTQGFLAWFYASGGRRGMAAAVLVNLAAGLANAAGCVVLIPRLGLAGAAWAFAGAQALSIAACYLPAVRRLGGAEAPAA